MAIPAIKYKEKHPNTKMILNCLDICPESAKNRLGKIGYACISSLSKKIYKKFDKILVSSKSFIDYMITQNKIDSKKLVYLPQHSGGDLVDKDLKNENTITNFMFAGNLGTAQRLDVIIKALALVKGSFVMNFVGTGAKEKWLKDLVEEFNLQNKVVFHGRKTYEQMVDYYRSADALIITLRGDNAVGNTLPNKLQTYMSSGKPIFGAINGSANEIIKQSKCGYCVNSGDFEGLAKLLQDFIDNPTKYKDCGENGRKFFKENFTFEIFMNNLNKELL